MTELGEAYADELADLTVAGAGTDRWLALCTDSGFTEATGGSYARQDITAAFGVSAGGIVTSTSDIVFTGLAADTYSHWAVFDASTSGVMAYRGALVTPVVVSGGGTLTVAAGDFDVTVTAVP